MSNEITEMAIQSGLETSHAELAAQQRFYSALQTIADGMKIEAGMGLGSLDFWLKIAGIEYVVQITSTGSGGEK